MELARRKSIPSLFTRGVSQLYDLIFKVVLSIISDLHSLSSSVVIGASYL